MGEESLRKWTRFSTGEVGGGAHPVVQAKTPKYANGQEANEDYRGVGFMMRGRTESGRWGMRGKA